MDTRAILGAAYKAHEHIAAVNALRLAHKRLIKVRLREIRSHMDVGLRQVGAAAEDCRPSGAEGCWERRHMQRLDSEFFDHLGDPH